MKGADIGETSSRAYYGKGGIRITPVKKQSGIPFICVLLLLLVGMEIEKYCFPVAYFVYHMVNCTNDNIRHYMVMVRHE